LLERDDISVKETVGAIAKKLLEKKHETYTAKELEHEMHQDYEKNIYDCIEINKPRYDGDFYVVVHTTKEPLMPNVIRNVFHATKMCPTPTYDQTVYKYFRRDDKVEFMWVVPAMDICEMFHDNILQIVPADRPLLKYVLDFYDGTLARTAIELNHEADNSRHLVPRKGELLC
jgi:hypothetical protein